MTPQDFLLTLEEEWPGKTLTDRQQESYLAKLARYSESQLDAIFERLLENCKFRPKVAHFYETADELGYHREARTPKSHTWEKTSCNLCAGEGRIYVFFAQLLEKTEYGMQTRSELRRIMPYSAGSKALDQPRIEENGVRLHPFLFRCSCSAGDMPTLPRAWPKWDSSKDYDSRFEPEEETSGFRQVAEEIPF